MVSFKWATSFWVKDYVSNLLKLYKKYPVLHKFDNHGGSFEWINCDDCDRSIFSFIRRDPDTYKGALLFICNFTPIEREDYCVGVPIKGSYKTILSSYSQVVEGDDMEAAKLKWDAKTKESYKAVEGECDGLEYRLNIPLKPFEAKIIAFPNVKK